MSNHQQMSQQAEERMKKTIDSLRVELTKLRTGRAHPSLLDHVMVSYYGNDMPLSQVASITAADARTLLVTPWEKAQIPAIEKAILSSDLGLNPATSGTAIRVPLPALTEARRKDLVKVVKAEAENARIVLRNIRRDANQIAKDLLKAKEMSEDDERRASDAIQKITDKYVAEVDKIVASKEAELMEV